MKNEKVEVKEVKKLIEGLKRKTGKKYALKKTATKYGEQRYRLQILNIVSGSNPWGLTDYYSTLFEGTVEEIKNGLTFTLAIMRGEDKEKV